MYQRSIMIAEDAELCEELLSTGALHCAACGHILDAPVYLTAAGTNVCDACRCRRPDAFSGAMANPALDMILERLRLPCAYRSRGCELTLPYRLYRPHLGLCSYRRDCLVAGCRWGGRAGDFPMHLHDDHPDLVLLEDQHGAFPIECPKPTTYGLCMLNTWHGRFIVRVRRLSDHLQLLVYNHDHTTEDEGHFVLQYALDVATVVQRRCRLVDHMDALIAFDVASTTKILLRDDTNLSSFRLVLKRHIEVSIATRRLQLLYRCYDCNMFILDEVHECPEGHHMCCCCVDKRLHMCISGKAFYKPVDSSTIKVIQIPKGEDLECLFPCLYAHMGCELLSPLVDCHSFGCEFREMPCPVVNCRYAHTRNKLNNHVLEKHTRMCLTGRSHNFLYMTGEGFAEISRFLLCYGRIFRHVFIYSSEKEDQQRLTWRVEEFGRRDESRFVYVVDIFDREGSKRLTLTHDCDYSILSPQEMPSSFLFGNAIGYTLTVFKRKVRVDHRLLFAAKDYSYCLGSCDWMAHKDC